MPNVVTSITRKLTAGRQDVVLEPRHRRDGWFDDADVWHDAENMSAALAHARASI